MNLVELKKDLTLIEILEDYIKDLTDEEKHVVPTSAILVLDCKGSVCYHNHIECDGKHLLGLLEIGKQMILKDLLNG